MPRWLWGTVPARGPGGATWPVCRAPAWPCASPRGAGPRSAPRRTKRGPGGGSRRPRSEEHTSELQSRLHLVCRLLLEKKKTQQQRAQALEDVAHVRAEAVGEDERETGSAQSEDRRIEQDGWGREVADRAADVSLMLAM